MLDVGASRSGSDVASPLRHTTTTSKAADLDTIDNHINIYIQYIFRMNIYI